MSFSQDSGGAALAFVTRVVTGEVITPFSKFNQDTQKVERTMKKVENPVIVFFANGSTIVMEEKHAEEKGFLSMPTIMNFEAVVDAESIAGRFKFGLTEAIRKEAWQQLEDILISGCLSRGGYPLDQRKAQYSEKSIFFSKRSKSFDDEDDIPSQTREVA